MEFFFEFLALFFRPPPPSLPASSVDFRASPWDPPAPLTLPSARRVLVIRCKLKPLAIFFRPDGFRFKVEFRPAFLPPPPPPPPSPPPSFLKEPLPSLLEVLPNPRPLAILDMPLRLVISGGGWVESGSEAVRTLYSP